MKIAFIGQKGIPFTFGGVEHHVEALATRLAAQGNEVSVYCRKWYTGSLIPQYKGVNLLYTKSVQTKNLDAITGSFTATLDAIYRGFDVIHYQGVGPALLSWIPRIFSPKTKVIVTFHCQDRLHGKWGLLARWMLFLGEAAACWFPHETVVVSKTLKDYVAKKYHSKVFYIPNGVSIVEFFPTDILQRFGLKKNQYILSVTRLISHKSVHHLIAAFNALKQENSRELTHDLKLVIVGEGVHTDKYVKMLKKMAADNPDIIFAGWQGGADLQTLYANAKMFAHPSTSEGLPLVVLEAMAYGLPIVASAIPEHQELINDRRYLFEVGNAQDLQRVIFWVLENQGIAKKTGELYCAKVAVDYNWDTAAEQLISLYRSMKENVFSSLPHFTVKKSTFLPW